MKEVNELEDITKAKRENSEYKKFIFNFFIISVILIIFFILVIIIIDPFYHYHAPIGTIQLIQEKEAYQNAGIARNLSYDAILTGSSMTENFRVSQINQLFNCNTIKLSFAGGKVPNYDILFMEAFKNKNVNIKNIFYGCDISAYIDDPNAEEPNKIPEYLYDENIFTDVKYVLNKSVMFEYALPYWKYSNEKNVPDIDYAYTWWYYYTFSQNEAMAQYSRPEQQNKEASNLYDENVKLNLKKIGKYIEENPNTKFNIFFPPYSILYYDYWNRLGKLDAIIHAQEIVANYFLQFSNVKLTSFMIDKDIVFNLDNYKDYTHYSEKINEYILKEMKEKNYTLTNDNCNKYFEEVREVLYNYNYDSLFSNGGN